MYQDETVISLVPTHLPLTSNIPSAGILYYISVDVSNIEGYTIPMPARITKESILTGDTRTLEMSQYTQEEFDYAYEAYKRGEIASLTEALPKLTPRALEFIRSGTLPEEW